ncbi:hypothetical protein GF325_12145 [Candidatus Bathyarchaeota archaeon]|nr:hypothetical protein [Candidatus Bathyarchaeota archaeon]
MGLSCGVAKKCITPTPDLGPVRIAGYLAPGIDQPRGAKIASGVHDDIHARAMVLFDGNTKIALVSVESIGLLGDFVQEIKVPLEAWGFPARNVFIFSTHTHAGPDTMGLWGAHLGVSGENKRYRYFLLNAILDAIKEASMNMVPVDLLKCHGERSDLVVNFREPSDLDGTITIIGFKGADGNLVSMLWGFSAQPEITNRENVLISGDYPSLVSSWIERNHGCVALFGLGCCGSQSPVACEQGFDALTKYAKDLHGTIESLLEQPMSVEDPGLEIRQRVVHVPVQNDDFHVLFSLGVFSDQYYNDGNVRSTIGKLRIGSVDLLHLPGEPFPGLIKGLHRDVPDNERWEQPVIISLSNDALGYFIPLKEFRHESVRWKDPVNHAQFTGHEDESMGPAATTMLRSCMKDIFQYKTILAVGAHADDLSIWCGGTLKKLATEGNKIVCVRVCDDWEDAVGLSREDAIRINQREADSAYEFLGATEIVHLMYPSDYLAGEDYIELREKIVRLIRAYQPDTVISFDLNGIDEENQDHVMVARAVNEACWQASFDALYPQHFQEGLGIHAVGERLLFARNPTVVNHFMDISDFVGDKVHAICMHESVMENFFRQQLLLARACKLHVDLLEKDHPSITKVNLLVRLMDREWGKRAGTRYAEAFNKVGAGMLRDLARDP